MIDHLKLRVADPAASRAFYEAALEPLGYRVLLDSGETVGMGKDRPDFWIAPAHGDTTVCHVAIRADSELEVQRFHARRWPRGRPTTARPARARTTTRTTTARSSTTPTATTSRP